MQFANGKEQLPGRHSSAHKSEGHASESSSGTGSSICGPRSRNSQFQGAKISEDAVVKTGETISEDAVVKTPKPTSPVKPENDHAPANSNTNDWSPLDDNILLALPNNSSPSREDVDAHISSILYGASTKSRLPAFAELLSEKLSP